MKHDLFRLPLNPRGLWNTLPPQNVTSASSLTGLQETNEDSSLQSFFPAVSCSAGAVKISDTIIIYLLTYLLAYNTQCLRTGKLFRAPASSCRDYFDNFRQPQNSFDFYVTLYLYLHSIFSVPSFFLNFVCYSVAETEINLTRHVTCFSR